MIESRAKLYLPMIVEIAAKYSLEIRMIMAFMWQESAFDTMAVRYEPTLNFQYMPKSYSDLLNISMDTEICFQHCSWGLMQVLGVKAREYGFNGPLHDLAQPYNGIEYGCRVLSKLTERYSQRDQIIAAYNAGSALASRTTEETFVNQIYVDGVKDKLRQVDEMLARWALE